MSKGLNYHQAGVDIKAADRAVELIKPLVKATRRPEVLADIGGFAGFFALGSGYKEPVLVSGTDGVGTKLLVSKMLGSYDTVGIDLVAMCVNDILVHGAEPLFFLDYIAVGHLIPEQIAELVAGVAEGCRQAGCALIGGETAELPGMYAEGDYDLAGFAVGVAEKEQLITGEQVTAGDVVIGLASSGLHSNGYSLARKALLGSEDEAERFDEKLGKTIGQALLTPTRIYVAPIKQLLAETEVHALAHITGGGIPGNLIRMIPEGLQAVIESSAWEKPAVFEMIAERGGVDEAEMYKAFNMGIGFMIVLPEAYAGRALNLLETAGEKAWLVGRIEPGTEGVLIK
ncbi:MAG: phosphoribosylformylglycinamidine cyclo-ligase [Methylocystaceae bacterium]